ncbi:hypothetical protein BKA70DRAFT_1418013 [Coprinopsis sp. MPI-PUGE-AT-0042]|nr:hypothetical protein BKA70DRAFT_1418013 [Coprinopsis sp. MPI-PUGE-AT-0042]
MKLCASIRYAVLLQSSIVLAQIPVNGQTFSRGLAIINAPAINSEHNAPGTLPISIDVSGNGRLPSDAYTPDSGLPTAYEELNIFLVSSSTGANLTVSVGPQLLTDEDGTVRHLNWQIPSCIAPGRYNMTFYETSRLEEQELYAITPIPITINNPSPADDCAEIQNDLEEQPQRDRPAPVSPFLPEGVASGTLFSIRLTEGANLPTATVGNPTELTTITAVIESPTVLVEGGNTRTSSLTWTSTATMRTQDLSGFVVVNSGKKTTPLTGIFALVSVLIAAFLV